MREHVHPQHCGFTNQDFTCQRLNLVLFIFCQYGDLECSSTTSLETLSVDSGLKWIETLKQLKMMKKML